MFVNTLEKDFVGEENQGLNAITHVVMVDNGLRIKSEVVKTIGDMLLMFTMNYPGFDLKHAPRINVFFTAFSRVDVENETAYGEEDDDDED